MGTARDSPKALLTLFLTTSLKAAQGLTLNAAPPKYLHAAEETKGKKVISLIIRKRRVCFIKNSTNKTLTHFIITLKKSAI